MQTIRKDNDMHWVPLLLTFLFLPPSLFFLRTCEIEKKRNHNKFAPLPKLSFRREKLIYAHVYVQRKKRGELATVVETRRACLACLKSEGGVMA